MLTSKPPITQNQIPTVKKLCEDLGFGHSYQRPESNLKDSTQSWRKQYKTKEGILGRNLIEWRQQKTQIDLKAMTKDYLEIGGYGPKHWPANSDGILEYPKDKHRIIDLLMQLFWKENTNEAHNAKHPDRGRRVRESIESDQSSTTVASPTMPDFPRPNYLPSRAPLQAISKPAYPGIGVGSVPKGRFALPRSELTHNQNDTDEGQNAAASPQSSGSLFDPYGADTDEASTAPQSSPPTLMGNSTESVVPDIPADIYVWADDDAKRPAKARASKLITSSFKHPFRSSSKDDTEPTSVAPVAKMQTTPAPAQKTPKKSRPDHVIPPSRSARAQAVHGRSSAEASRRRGRDVDGDDENAEYIPGPRSKRRKTTSSASEDAPIVLDPRLSEHEIEAFPIPPPAEGTMLPTRAKGKRPVSIDLTASKIDKQQIVPDSPPIDTEDGDAGEEAQEYLRSFMTRPSSQPSHPLPDSPLMDTEHGDPIEEAEQYLRTSMTRPSSQPPQQLSDQGTRQAEHSLPSLPPNPAPSVPFRTINDAGDMYERGASLERPPQPQPRPCPPLRPEIQYYIIASRTPRLSKIHWPEGSLADKSVNAIFDEISDVASKRNVQRIAFKLTTSVSDIQYTITRKDVKIFEIMKKAFAKDVNADMARGNREFEIEMEVDPGRVGVRVEEEEERGVDFGFSF